MKREGCSIIFLDSRERVLLLLRDDIPEIPYPNTWDLPGGHVEPGETPEVCIAREMKEEMGLDLSDFELASVFPFTDRVEYTFWKRSDMDVDAIQLTEGQCLKWFDRATIAQMTLAYGFNEIIEDFFITAPFRYRW